MHCPSCPIDSELRLNVCQASHITHKTLAHALRLRCVLDLVHAEAFISELFFVEDPLKSRPRDDDTGAAYVHTYVLVLAVTAYRPRIYQVRATCSRRSVVNITPNYSRPVLQSQVRFGSL